MARNLNRNYSRGRGHILGTIAQSVRTKARKLFPRQPLRTWFVMLTDKHWRAFVINTQSKMLMCTGPIASSADEALKELSDKLDLLIRRSPSGRTRKTP